MSIVKHLLSLAFAFGVAASAQASVTYTSVPNGGAFASLGTWDTTSVGEVFTVPVDGNNSLDSFSFYLRGDLSAAYAGITTWNAPANEFGSDDLFTSEMFGAYFDDYTEVSFDTGGLALTPGQQYLAYLSVWFLEDAGSDQVELGGGSAAHVGSTYVNGDPRGTGWSTPMSGGLDLAGRLVFSGAADGSANVPEPASLALMGLGIAGLACMRRRVK
jgi:hypothetical protein